MEHHGRRIADRLAGAPVASAVARLVSWRRVLSTRVQLCASKAEAQSAQDRNARREEEQPAHQIAEKVDDALPKSRVSLEAYPQS